jgi:hypothetical protein
MFKSLVVLALIFSSSPSSAGEISIFGLEIGKPLKIVELCDFSNGKYLWKLEKVCISNDRSGPGNRPWGPLTYEIAYPKNVLPNYVQPIGDMFVEVEVYEGKIERINFFTWGVEVQDIAYSDLKKKFSKPKSLNKVVVQNGYGAKFLKIEAKWSMKQGSIEFEGIENSSVDSGHVDVTSKTYDKLYSDWEKVNRVEKLPL